MKHMVCVSKSDFPMYNTAYGDHHRETKAKGFCNYWNIINTPLRDLTRDWLDSLKLHGTIPVLPISPPPCSSRRF